MKQLKKLLSWFSLATPKSVVFCMTLAHGVLLLIPYEWLDNARLSLYERGGINSPSIGTTRAYWRVLHGDLSGAYERNNLIIIIAPLIIILYVVAVYRLIKKNNSKNKV